MQDSGHEGLAARNDDLAVPLDDLANIGTMPHEELPYARQARDGPLELRAHLALVGVRVIVDNEAQYALMPHFTPPAPFFFAGARAATSACSGDS